MGILKIRIKNFTIQFCVARARNQNDQAKTLEARINYIDSVLINTEDKQLKKGRIVSFYLTLYMRRKLKDIRYALELLGLS